MRIPYSWLADWVELPWNARELGSRLTMSGFEVEAIEPAAPAFSGVVVAEILSAERHPQADKLQVCRVAFGEAEPVQIVCGAANARAGLKCALAVVGAKLPGDIDIKPARLRGVESFGMLTSARELGLAESSSGILELPPEAPVGQPLREYLDLDDEVLEIAVTPNRGDAMSVLGIAREVAVLLGGTLGAIPDLPASTDGLDSTGSARGGTSSAQDRLAVHLEAPAACPSFAGCIIRDVNNRAPTPIWLRERLRRSGVRSISPVVDVTNYIMLELGQPMHAYDLAKLRGEIRVRHAHSGEAITLLDGRSIKAEPDVLFITDREGPVGVAGVMGGERTAVSADTRDVFFEGAFFAPEAVIGRARRWGLVTDASQRFERGVDPSLQQRAVERATSLLRSIAGGAVGPVTLVQSVEHLPQRKAVSLRRSQLERLLGLRLPDERVATVLTALKMQVVSTAHGWEAMAPPHRFDIAIEADLIEEVARIVGFEAISEADARGPHRFRSLTEERASEHVMLEALAMRGYEEAITFAFVDPALQAQLFPDQAVLMLVNPIASDLSAMRLSLWPGLLRCALENQRRQQDRIRLFEHGARFIPEGRRTREVDSIAGIAVGPRLPEQWGLAREVRVPVDFFDVKSDLEALLTATGERDAFIFEAAADGLTCLHPGRSARIMRGGRAVGWLGELHPSLVKSMDFTYPPVLFELEVAALAVRRPHYHEISRFPQVRRDLAVVLDESIPLSALAERVTLVAASLLQTFRVFDVYRGPGIESGRKSVALGLIFQDISRTLTDDDVERLIASIVADLRVTLNARIRE
ncbi:MAG TPA: phenylalanine--tRNA ligase subunit beta [Steroidobacteraceae bacterium]|nr:phenylalanine--tRNA ligase subunit beta [Steroidobacteraceae bacterium]